MSVNIWDTLAAPVASRYDPKLMDFVVAEVDREMSSHPGLSVSEAKRMVSDISNRAMEHCEHKNELVLKLKTVNDTIQFRRFCSDCGHKTNALSHAKLTAKERASAVDDDGSYLHRQVEGKPLRVKYSSEELREAVVDRLHEHGVSFDYYEHLQSQKWTEEIRTRIHALDGGKCQICHQHPAQQTHHLVYYNTGNESDEELLSVCRECHQKISLDIMYFRQLASSYVYVREAAFYKDADRKQQHYEVMKRKIQALQLKPDDYSRRITELAKAMEL